MDRSFKTLAVVATVVMFVVMIAGSLVTNTGSAQGCGNQWPLCNGKLIPAYTFQTMIEFSHRMVTGLAGVIVIVFSIWAWLRNRGNREALFLALFGMLFIVVESLLGAAAVIWEEPPAVLALHFGFSLLAFSGVFLLTLFALQQDKRKHLIRTATTGGFRWYVVLMTVYTYCEVYLGAYVRHSGAMLACPEWPLCSNGQLVPSLTGLVGIQMWHRIAAMGLFCLIVGLVVYARRHFRQTRRDIYVGSIIALLLAVFQIFTGGYAVLSDLHIYATTLHTAGITLLFGTLFYLCVQSFKVPEHVRVTETERATIGS